jgi:CRISPR-associated endonuclease Csn1
LSKSDEELAEVFEALGDDAELVKLLKALYDWSILADILSGAKYISDKKTEVYNTHKRDLMLLKRLVRSYVPSKYAEIFRDENKSGSYAYYAKSGKTEDFSKYVKNIFKGIIVNSADADDFNDMLARLELNTFCPKQVNTDNRVIPYQVYWVELKQILDNASKYLPFLNNTEDGYDNKNKILSIMEFRIPYFVGPLNRASKEFAWFERKAEGKIYPWNFHEKVNIDKSEQSFINRMTNTCSYIPDADVLPKCSLLHEKFQVLNEINTLTVNGRRLPVDVKQKLFLELFLVRKKITKKSIKEFLLLNNLYKSDELDTLGGIDEIVKSSLSSHIAFKHLLETSKLSKEDAELIIERRTYTEDKKRFVKWIYDKYSNLTDFDRKYLSSLNFNDFARVSKELLCDVYGTESDSDTGEACSIIDRMWNENLNLMEILSERYTYRINIEDKNAEYFCQNSKSIDERIKEMNISNSVKRPIIRALDIVSDVVKANGIAPKKIFVEMARGGKPENKGKRTASRYQQLKALYAKCNLDDAREMETQLELMGEERDNRLQGEKLFLYYLQLGKCAYTGKSIDIEHISDNVYDIDHIYPQSKVKDDSVLNNKVLVLSEENGKKGDKYPIDKNVQKKMAGWWKLLLENELITEEKYKRLTRITPFDENEEWGFINRQLVETRQSTKALALLLKERYCESEIVYVKAGMVSEFRQEFDMLKCRSVNDYHHAKDAYLNIVVGNVYSEQFTHKWFMANRQNYNLKVSTLFSRKVTVGERLIWDGSKSIAGVKNIIHNKNAIHVTRYAFCRKGGFFDQNPVKAAENLISIKKGLLTEKYGGYNRTTASFFVLAKCNIEKKSEVMLVPVELLEAKAFLENEKYALQYTKKTISKITGKSVDSVEFPLGTRQIKINTVFDFDGMRMSIAGKSNGGKSIVFSLVMPLIIGYKWEKYVKHLEKFIEKLNENAGMKYNEAFDKISASKNVELYDLLTEKMGNKPYMCRPANPVEILKKGRDKFIATDVYKQSKCLMQILIVFNKISGGCDLNLIGGSGNAAATILSSFLNNWKKKFSNVCIIDQKASGLYESRSKNLIDLL